MAACMLAGTNIASAGPTLVGVGVPAHPVHPESIARAVNADGSIVVGYDGTPHAFRWTSLTGLVDLGTGGQPHSFAYGISGDATTIVGRFGDAPEGEAYRPFRWTAESGIVQLTGFGDPSFAYGVAHDASFDGTVIVGGCSGAVDGGSSTHATGWVNAGPPLDLGTLDVDGESEALAISSDGSVIVGFDATVSGALRSVRWSAENGWAAELLGPMPGASGYSLAAGVTSDGKTIVGTAGAAQSHAFRWTQEGGYEDLGSVLGYPNAIANAISGDGTVIVGDCFDMSGGTSVATMWSAQTGMVDLNKYLANIGVDMTGWALRDATGVSDDGQVIVGWGEHNGEHEGFVVTLDCVDKDQDGLCDDWEINGIPYTGVDGAARRYLLDSDGDGISDANPLRKDIFVEYDSMSGFEPPFVAMERVKEAFDRAPVPTVAGLAGGLPGISLHLVNDKTNVRQMYFPSCFVDFYTVKEANYGTVDERSDPSWTELRKAKAKAYRYCVFGLGYKDNNGDWTSGGVAEGYGCDDFMVTLEAWYATTPLSELHEDFAAATFMHELGHTLGLHHGGEDDVNFKPNYFSIMNYTWAMPMPYIRGGPGRAFRRYFPDYSRVALPQLNESVLDESIGIQGLYPELKVPYSIPLQQTNCDLQDDQGINLTCDGLSTPEGCTRYAPFVGWVDWNSDCADTPTPAPVSSDLNFILEGAATPGQEMFSFEDWSKLRYNFRGSPYAAAGAIPPTPEGELTASTFAALLATPPPQDCFTVLADPPTTLCASGAAAISVTAVGAGSAPTFSWMCLTPTGRMIAMLTDGQFTDSITGMRFEAFGASTATLSISSARRGTYRGPVRFVAIVGGACGTVESPELQLVMCEADFNCDGFLTFEDFDSFVGAFESGGSSSDFNADGFLTFEDFDAFVGAFEAGCLR